MAIIGFIAGFIVLAIVSVSIGFMILFGGEEFSHARGGFLFVLLIAAATLSCGWYLLFKAAPFEIHMSATQPAAGD